ncbi:halocyanin domain-containing protein [Haloarcula sp. Atlit-120R]|uniref:halocyanin domain-containing protein n=1 Tax=Haloarcula sp. Atlit-120R TaxID=2282135 RepID=UPI000EF1F0ED|nr:halocyanin domain-containing protein [Haloarcula sp. Atlit-120R]RLM37233.1 halocyanin domain-containing protein [Haloarcula sp. Atlit-120R]
MSSGSSSKPAAETGTATETATPTTTPEQTPEPTPESLDDWLDDANGYDGEPHRYGPESRPTILVGQETDGGLAFSPPAIEVPPGTIVRWDWTGHGGQQNVVAVDGTFDSGRTNAQPGTGYHYFFEETGEYRYVSEPHRDDGMKGAIIVKEPPSSGNTEVDEWLVESSNFDGTIIDRTGTDTATVTTGAEGNGGGFAFDPPALKVSTETTVRWEWTGEGGPHNIVSKGDGPLDSELVAEDGSAYQHTFEETGTYLYSCKPHQGLGMRGAIIVE